MTKPREQLLRQSITKHLVEVIKFYNTNVENGFESLAQDALFRVIDTLDRCEIRSWPMYEFGGKNGAVPCIREYKVIWPGQVLPETIYRK